LRIGSQGRLITFVLGVLLSAGVGGAFQDLQKPEPPPTFEDLLRKIAVAPGNACEDIGERDFSEVEMRLFWEAEKAVAQKLNEAPIAGSRDNGHPRADSSGADPRASAIDALQNLERLSAEINKSWRDENRFHFQVLEVPPALLVKMTFRNRATFSFFAIPERDFDSRPAGRWRAIGAVDSFRAEPAQTYEQLELFPLERGPAKRARFLAVSSYAGCGSGVGISYHAYEWDPQDYGDLSEFIKIEGSVSQEEPTDSRLPERWRPDAFNPIGELRTTGPLITLPYCWHSAIDTWNNPSLCAVDSYDLSGDRVRFASTAYNRPDLVPIAKAIQYAQARDYPAVRAYCASPDVARQIVGNVQPYVFGEAIEVKRIGALKERVELGYRQSCLFEVEKRGTRWLVVSFQMD